MKKVVIELSRIHPKAYITSEKVYKRHGRANECVMIYTVYCAEWHMSTREFKTVHAMEDFIITKEPKYRRQYA